MSRARRPASLRREIVLGYSLLLAGALVLFSGATYLILKRFLSTTATASLRETAFAAEQVIVPPNVPRVAVVEELVHPGPGDVEALRRRIRLATGDELNIYVARTGDVESQALRAFALIALLLVPVTVAGAALAGWSVADRLLKPLNRLVAASREIGIGALSRRVAEPAQPRELQELAQAYNGMLDRLQAAVEELRRFTADASHELRTPLTVIRGTAEVALARERSPEELRATLGEVLDETRGMLHMVEDLLALARGEEAAAAAGPAPVDLSALLHEVGETGAVLATGRPVEVRVNVPPGLQVQGAPGPLRRLFLNLVSNAVKFTERGEVSVEAHPREGGAVEVSVRDTGVGIGPGDLPHVFDRFYRGDSSRGRGGGTGLGLSIARMIARQHGGDIRAESEPGRGSEFRVRLGGAPLAPNLQRGEASAEPPG